MRVFTFISGNGDSVAVAKRVQDEGHRVIFYNRNANTMQVGSGLIEKYKDVNPVPDCVVLDKTTLEGFPYANVPTLGNSTWGNRISLDKSYMKKVLKALGLLVAKGDEGTKITMEMWFNGEECLGVLYSMYDDTLMEGGKGPRRCHMGSVVWVGSLEDRLFVEGGRSFLPALAKVGFKGCLTLTLRVTEAKVQVVDTDTRLNLKTLYILAEMVQCKLSDLLYSIAVGVAKPFKYKGQVGMGVVLALPPYPHVAATAGLYGDTSIQGLNKFNLKHFWMYDVIKKGKNYSTAGCGGLIGTVTARGDDIPGWSPLRDARRRVMRTIGKLDIPDVMYRRDVGDKVEGERTKLKSWGWIS